MASVLLDAFSQIYSENKQQIKELNDLKSLQLWQKLSADTVGRQESAVSEKISTEKKKSAFYKYKKKNSLGGHPHLSQANKTVNFHLSRESLECMLIQVHLRKYITEFRYVGIHIPNEPQYCSGCGSVWYLSCGAEECGQSAVDQTGCFSLLFPTYKGKALLNQLIPRHIMVSDNAQIILQVYDA